MHALVYQVETVEKGKQIGFQDNAEIHSMYTNNEEFVVGHTIGDKCVIYPTVEGLQQLVDVMDLKESVFGSTEEKIVVIDNSSGEIM
jgi:hypothetical protein